MGAGNFNRGNAYGVVSRDSLRGPRADRGRSGPGRSRDYGDDELGGQRGVGTVGRDCGQGIAPGGTERDRETFFMSTPACSRYIGFARQDLEGQAVFLGRLDIEYTLETPGRRVGRRHI